VFKGKVFEQNETLQPIGKVIKKILIRKQNYAQQNPTITCRGLTISHNIEFTSYCSRLHNVKTKRDKRTANKSVKVQAVLEDDTLK